MEIILRIDDFFESEDEAALVAGVIWQIDRGWKSGDPDIEEDGTRVVAFDPTSAVVPTAKGDATPTKATSNTINVILLVFVGQLGLPTVEIVVFKNRFRVFMFAYGRLFPRCE